MKLILLQYSFVKTSLQLLMQLAWLLRKWMNHFHSSVVARSASSCIFSTTSTWPKLQAELSWWSLCSQAWDNSTDSAQSWPDHHVQAWFSKSNQSLAEVGESTFAVTNALAYGMNGFIWRVGQQTGTWKLGHFILPYHALEVTPWNTSHPFCENAFGAATKNCQMLPQLTL